MADDLGFQPSGTSPNDDLGFKPAEQPKLPDTAPIQNMVIRNMANQQPSEGAEPQTDAQRLDAGLGFSVTGALKGGTDKLPADVRGHLIDAYKAGTATDAADYMQSALPAAAYHTTAIGAFGRGAEQSVLPSLTGFAAFAPGAAAGAELAAIPAAMSGPFAPLVEGGAALVGGILSSMGASFATGAAQKAFLEAHPQIASALGLDNQKLITDVQEHPVASFAGELAPNLALMRPGNLRLPQVALGGALGAGQEAGRELVSDEKLSPEKIALSTIMTAITNKETSLGSAISSKMMAGYNALRPSVADAIGKPVDSVTHADIDQAIAKGFEGSAPKASDFHDVAAVMDNQKTQPQDLRDVSQTMNFKTGQPSTINAYHGTPRDFETFEGEHHFFTNDIDIAKSYAHEPFMGEEGQAQPNIRNAKIQMDNPKVIDAQGKTWAQIGDKGTSSNYEAHLAQEEGHDGLIIKNVRDAVSDNENVKPSDVYVSFDAKKIGNVSKATLDTLHDIYKETGVPPDQVFQDAKDHPEVAADIAAGRVPGAYESLKEPVAEGKVEPKSVGDVSDELFRNANARTADKVELIQRLKSIQDVPEETFEKLQRYEQTPDKVALLPEEKELYDRVFAPIKEESNNLAKYIVEHGGEDIVLENEGYTPRQVKGGGGALDRLENPEVSDIKTKGKSLSTFASSAQNREFFGIDTPDGRKIVSVDKDGNIFDVGPKADEPVGKLIDENATAGSKVELLNHQGADLSLSHATIDEIEGASGGKIQYHKNLLGTRMTNLMELRNAARNIEMIEGWKKDPAMSDAVVWPKEEVKIPRGFVQISASSLPKEFHGAFFEPHIAEALEDFLPQIKDDTALNKIEKVGMFTRAAMFFNPIKHMANVTFQYLMSKGLAGTAFHIPSTMENLHDAFNEVVNQGPQYQEMLRSGASLPYSKQIAAQFPDELQRAMGAAVDANPEMMSSISKLFGYANPINWVKAVYGVSSKVLWSYGDMLTMARINDLKDKGLSNEEAIREAERVMPDYRVPTRVAGSRVAAQALQSPMSAEFGRYQYNRLRSFGEVIGDIFGKGNDIATRAHGVDQAMFVAVMMSIGYPLLDKLAQTITSNNQASIERSGDAKLVQNMIDWGHGKKDVHQVLMSTFSPGFIEPPLEMATNTNFYTGQHIVPENDLRQLNLKHIGYDMGAFALGQISPANEAMKGLEGKSDLEHFVEGQLMINNPTPQQLRGQNIRNKLATKEQRAATRKLPDWAK